MVIVKKESENTSARIRLILGKTISYICLILLAALCLFFFFLLFINTTRSNSQIQAAGLSLKPGNYFFKNFDNLFHNFKGNFDVVTGFKNSVIIALCSSVLTCYFSALTAYGIHAYQFKGKKFAEAFIMAIMMIPSQLSSVGFYQLAVQNDWTNHLWPLIIPSIAAPATFFYMIQYLRATLPLDLVEASRMDGSSEFGTFNRIVLPIMKPAIAVQMIFSFVGSWNNLYMPSLLLTEPEMKTLPVMISALQTTSWGSRDLGAINMAIFLSIIPVVIVYLILSKFIIKGVTSGSVKG